MVRILLAYAESEGSAMKKNGEDNLLIKGSAWSEEEVRQKSLGKERGTGAGENRYGLLDGQ